MHRVAAPTATLGRVEPSATHSAVPQPIGGVYSLGGSIESHLIPPPLLHAGEGSSFPGLVPSDDVVNPDSVMAIKPGDSGVVIGYQVDEFTCTYTFSFLIFKDLQPVEVETHVDMLYANIIDMTTIAS